MLQVNRFDEDIDDISKYFMIVKWIHLLKRMNADEVSLESTAVID